MSDVLYRPRSASEIVDAAFQLLRRNFKSFVTITAVTYVPVLLSLLALQRAYGVQMAQPSVEPGYYLATAVVTLLWYALSSSALALAAADAYAGAPVDAAGALRRAAVRMPSVLVAMIVKWLAAGIGFLLFFVPGFYIATRWFAVPAAMMIEGTGPFAGLGRSWRLASDAKWRIFGALALVWIIYFLLGIALSATGMIMQSQALLQVMSALSAIFVYPLLPVTDVVLYFDARIRREGYDIELLERELGAPPAGTATPEQPAY